jgi:hypothetical protein
MVDWQPIETIDLAMFEGEDFPSVLVFAQHDDIGPDDPQVYLATYMPDCGWYVADDSDCSGLTPTHWAPCPDHPNELG